MCQQHSPFPRSFLIVLCIRCCACTFNEFSARCVSLARPRVRYAVTRSRLAVSRMLITARFGGSEKRECDRHGRTILRKLISPILRFESSLSLSLSLRLLHRSKRNLEQFKRQLHRHLSTLPRDIPPTRSKLGRLSIFPTEKNTPGICRLDGYDNPTR